MTVPTHEDLNRAMAQVLGWQEEKWPQSITPEGRKTFGVPDYCNGQDAAELGRFIAQQPDSVLDAYEREAARLSPSRSYKGSACMTPKQIVIAALLALDKWPDSWDKPLPSQPLSK